MKGRLAVVAIAALDLRRKPGHRVELRSQLLMGEVVRVLGRNHRRRWLRVENQTDGYRGWVRAWGLLPMDASGVAGWRRRARARVVVRHAEVRVGKRSGPFLTPVFWNTVLVAHRSRGGWCQVELPDGRRGWIARAAISTGRRRAVALAQQVERLLGVPYLWGGRTPLGFDCSGFVQQLFAARGIWLPRDAEQQRRFVRPLGPRERPRAGDLAFFGPRGGRVSHVGVLVGRGLYAHARGTVRVNSLEPSSRLCDKALLRMLRGFGRPAKGGLAEG